MDKEKVLVLVNQTENEYFPQTTDSFVLKPLYRSNSYVSRIIRKIALKLDWNLVEQIIYMHWITDVSRCNTIVIFDIGNAREIVRFIKQRYPQKRIIFWYWNSVSHSIDIKTIIDLNIEIWSFDKNDCQRYGLKNNTQFFFKENTLGVPNSYNIEFNDIFFVGADKNRSEILEKLAYVFEEYGLNFYFHIVKSSKDKKKHAYKYTYSKPIKYAEIVGLVSKCKAILDLVAKDQAGLTLRPLEALYFKKKLITNYKNIKTEKLYNPNNIFILGEDDDNKLREFVYAAYDEKDYFELCKYYSGSEWIKRF